MISCKMLLTSFICLFTAIMSNAWKKHIFTTKKNNFYWSIIVMIISLCSFQKKNLCIVQLLWNLILDITDNLSIYRFFCCSKSLCLTQNMFWRWWVKGKIYVKEVHTCVSSCNFPTFNLWFAEKSWIFFFSSLQINW